MVHRIHHPLLNGLSKSMNVANFRAGSFDPKTAEAHTIHQLTDFIEYSITRSIS